MLNFLIHLRLHYQFFILSGGYLLGGLLVPDPEWGQFWAQFINVHVLLFGGATAFNSYWDKDEGPIGGLRNPPKMQAWMRDASMFMQFAGLIWAFTAGILYALIYLISIIFFWLYSTPIARWKGRPVLSLVAIGVSTGTNSLLLGAIAAGGRFSVELLFAGAGTAFIMLSLYPVSQIYQMSDDSRRGDRTFASHFGIAGVRRFYFISFITGTVAISISLLAVDEIIAKIFAVIGIIVWILLSILVNRLQGDAGEYETVMRIKLIASFSFVIFIVTILLLKHL